MTTGSENATYEYFHTGGEGYLGDKKLIIDMSYIFEKVLNNAIQIHLNLNWALRVFDVMDNYPQ